MSGIYEFPWFSESRGLTQALLGGFNFAGTLTFESGQKATVLSGIDSNLNGDAAATVPSSTRMVLKVRVARSRPFEDLPTKTAGNRCQATWDTATIRTHSTFRPGRGVFTTPGATRFNLPGIDNLDLTIYKNFAITESTKMQFRVDFFNAFNHPQYIPGSPNAVIPVSTTSVAQVNTISLVNTSFNKADEVFSSNPRVIQMALRFTF